MKALDISNSKLTGYDLAEAIEHEVADSQRVLVQELPSVLIMTQSQFEDLSDISGMPEMYESKDRLYRTKLNVMEVRIKE